MFRVDRQDRVAIVTIDRPEKRNAMSPTFFRELPQVLDTLGREPSLRALVLTGAGEAFSAGGDIASFAELHGTAAVRRHLRLVFDAFHAVERAELPVIAAVNGIAFGGGTELTLACDLVVASERAQFSFKEATVGLIPGYGVVRGPAVIGRHWTRWLALTADVIDAPKALEIGLVQQVVPHEALLDEARRGRGADRGPSAARDPARQAVRQPRHGRGARREHRDDRAPLHDRRPRRGRRRIRREAPAGLRGHADAARRLDPRRGGAPAHASSSGSPRRPSATATRPSSRARSPAPTRSRCSPRSPRRPSA